jgi:hypothetical protein
MVITENGESYSLDGALMSLEQATIGLPIAAQHSLD